MIAPTNTVLVTGGAGYVGSHVSKALSVAGYVPVCYDNLSRGFRWAVKWGPFEQGDIGDAARLKSVLDTYAPVGVIHLAGYAYVGESVTFPELYRTNNVEGSRVLIETLSQPTRAKIPVVFSSTCSIYGDQGTGPLNESLPAQPINPYAKGKLAVEEMLCDYREKSGGQSVALRYFNASGADPDGDIGEAHDPETHLIPLTLEAAAGIRPEITVFGTAHGTPDGSCIRDYVHVSDLADAHVAALERMHSGSMPSVINLANGRGYSVFEVIDAVRRATGRDVNVRLGEARAGDPAVLVGDAGLAKAVLGWAPQYSALDTQVQHAWAWFEQYRNRK